MKMNVNVANYPILALVQMAPDQNWPVNKRMPVRANGVLAHVNPRPAPMIGYTAQLCAQVGPEFSFRTHVRPRIIVPTVHPPPVVRMSAVSDQWIDAPMAVVRT